jgi:hypothetical protein
MSSDFNLLDWRSTGAPRVRPGNSLSLRQFEVCDFGHALLRRTRGPAVDRQRRQERAVREPLAVFLGVPDDRNQIPAVSRPRDVFDWRLSGHVQSRLEPAPPRALCRRDPR